MKGQIRKLSVLLGVLIVIISYVYAVAPDPAGPQTLTKGLGETFNGSLYTSARVDAEAGNITALTISALSATQTWQGYYGNVTGTITLDDADNWTMYSWYSAEPQGEIYASNTSTVTWSAIHCVNYTANASEGSQINLSVLEEMFGLASGDYDGVDETFNSTGKLSDGATDHSGFFVGQYEIIAGTCPATDTYEVDSSTRTNFQEVLLTDNASIIFTAIIENDETNNATDVYGYDNSTHDFQMLVGEDGHSGNTDSTPYYFFVELE